MTDTANSAVSWVMPTLPQPLFPDVVDATRRDFPEFLVFEVVYLDAFGIALRPIIGAAIAKISDQFLLLRIHGDNGLVSGLCRHNPPQPRH